MLIRHLTPVKGSSMEEQCQAEEEVELHSPGKASFYSTGETWKENCPSGCPVWSQSLHGAALGRAWPGEEALSTEQAPRCQLLATLCGWVAHLLIS